MVGKRRSKRRRRAKAPPGCAEVSSPSCEESTIRILLLGRSGCGKSASGNTILGKQLFQSPRRHKEPVTKECVEGRSHVAGREVCVIDTVDLLHPDLTEEQISQEREKCLSLSQSGLDAVLLVVPIGEELKNEEEMLEFAKGLFGPNILNFVIVLFTHGHDLGPDETIEDYIKEEGGELQKLVRHCGDRVHVFNNKCTDQKQVTELLHKIDGTVKSNSGKFCLRKRRRSRDLVEKFAGDSETLGEPCDLQPPDDRPEQIRLVLLGKTGAGKSASGNSILGRNAFDSTVKSSSQTKQCCLEKTVRGGKEVIVVDTPGLFDTELSEDEVLTEIFRCVTYSCPGPHVFLLVISLATRFTAEEKQTVEVLSKTFAKNADKYTMILFTHKDQLKQKTIEEYLREGSADLQELVERCGGRYHCLNNESPSYEDFKEIIRKVESMDCGNDEKFYTTEMFQKVEEEIQQRQKEKLEEKTQKFKEENPNVTKTEWQRIYWKLVEESRHEAQIHVGLRDRYLRLFWGSTLEETSGIEAAVDAGVSRNKAVSLAMKASAQHVREKMCKIQ